MFDITDIKIVRKKVVVDGETVVVLISEISVAYLLGAGND